MRLSSYLAILGVFVVCVNAELTYDSNLESLAGFSYQCWDFGNDEAIEPTLPCLPDGDPNYINIYGEPVLQDVSFSTFAAYWTLTYPQFSTTRTGMYGGMADATATFYIPGSGDIGDVNLKKILRVEAICFAKNVGDDHYSLEVASDANFESSIGMELLDCQIDMLDEPDGVIGKWYRVNAAYNISKSIDQQYVRFTAFQLPSDPSHPMGGATMLDEIAVTCYYTNVCDIVPDGVVNNLDFAKMAENWLTGYGE